MAMAFFWLLAALAPHKCMSARMKAVGGKQAVEKTSFETDTQVKRDQCTIRDREGDLGLVWKFPADGCHKCIELGIYTKDERNKAFEGAFDAKYEDGRCHCRDKHGAHKLPTFNSKMYCSPRYCWEIFQKLGGVYKKTNMYLADPTCTKCDDEVGPACDDVDIGQTFTSEELKKKKKDGTLPQGVPDFNDDEPTTTTKPKDQTGQTEKCPEGVPLAIDHKEWPRQYSCCVARVCKESSDRVLNRCCAHLLEDEDDDNDSFGGDDDTGPEDSTPFDHYDEDEEDCDTKITEALAHVNYQLQLYMVDCHIQASDFSQANDGKVTVKDDTRLCASSCRNTMDAQNTNMFDIDGLRRDCSSHSSFAKLARIAAAISVFRTSQSSCKDTRTPAGGGGSGGTCPDLAMTYQDCGTPNMKPEDCPEGCCWHPTKGLERKNKRSRPWCYHSKKTATCTIKCAHNYAPDKREDCAAFLIADDANNPDDEVRGQACRDVGCCWQPLEHGSKHPWCFYKPCV